METEPRGFDSMSVTMKRVTSCSVYFSNFAFGMAYNFLSPSLVELKNKYETTIDDISTVFTITLLGYLMGALICGILFNYLNRQLMVVGLLYVMAIGVIAIPHIPTKTLFFAIGGVIGFTAGGWDTSQVVWLLEMWHGQAGLYVQMQYFFFAVGTLVAPILLKPYLLEENKNETATDKGEMYDSLSSTNSPSNYTQESELYIPLSIGGSIIVLGATSILFLYFFDKYIPPVQAKENEIRPEDISSDSNVNYLKFFTTLRNLNWEKVLLITLSALVLGFYQGMELCTFQFLPTFTHYVDLRLPEPDGASILSGLTGAYTAGRLAGIFISYYKVRPAWILLFNLIIAIAGNVILLLFANSNLTLLWVGAVLLGLGYSTVFACIYDHIEKHLQVTNAIAAVMIIVGGLVSAIYPLIIGDAVEYTPLVLIYVIFFSLLMCTITFSSIYYMTIIRARNFNNPV